MVNLYVLKLEEGKYYVGKSKNTDYRIKKHFKRAGSAWTRKYKPLEIVEIIHNCDLFDEDKITIKYMDKFGIDNVRGGSFVRMELPEEEVIVLKRMLITTKDVCYLCESPNHFAKFCPLKEERNRLEKEHSMSYIFCNINISNIFCNLFSWN